MYSVKPNVHEVLSCRRKRKIVWGGCLSKCALHPNGTKVCSNEAFLPIYQALTDNTYTTTLLSVLRNSCPELIY